MVRRTTVPPAWLWIALVLFQLCSAASVTSLREVQEEHTDAGHRCNISSDGLRIQLTFPPQQMQIGTKAISNCLNVSGWGSNATALKWIALDHLQASKVSVPAGAFAQFHTVFPAANRLELINGVTIEESAFAGLRVAYLDLRDCGLTQLARGAFDGAVIGQLLLQQNNLRTIDPGWFRNFTISSNVVSLFSPDDCGIFLGNDIYVDIHHPQAGVNAYQDRIPKGAFHQIQFEGRCTFSLSNCVITELPSGGAFGLLGQTSNTTGLIALDISRNRLLSTLQNGTFWGLGRLKSLQLEASGVSSISKGTFQDLGSLADLRMGWNELQSLSHMTFDGLNRSLLQTLDLDYTPIEYIQGGTFEGMTSLGATGLYSGFKVGRYPSSSCNVSQDGGSPRCSCAVRRWAQIAFPGYVSQTPADDSCVCPEGWYSNDRNGTGMVRVCQRCERGSYQPSAGQDTCVECPAYASIGSWVLISSTTRSVGRSGSGDCEINQSDLRLCILLVVGLVLLLACFLVLWCRQKRLKEDAEAKYKHLEAKVALRDSEAVVRTCLDEIQFLKDWRIKQTQLSFKPAADGQAVTLGEGAEGKVYKCCFKQGGKPTLQVAVKTLNRESRKVWEEAEIAFLMAVRHERLVECIGAGEFESEPLHPEKPFSAMFCVIEYMSGGAITCRLWDEATLGSMPFESVSWMERITWASDAAEGMSHIHMQGYTHRDLKSMNILFDLGSGRAKVADFGQTTAERQHVSRQSGLGSINEDSQAGLLRTADCGTTQWMAPELCANQDAIHQKWSETVDLEDSTDVMSAIGLQSYNRFRDGHSQIEYTQKVDVYSFGNVLHELLTHQAPWIEIHNNSWFQTRDQIIHLVAQGKRPSVAAEARARAPEGWCALMEECQSQHADNRPSFVEIFARLKQIRMRELSIKEMTSLLQTRLRFGEAEAPLLLGDYRPLSSPCVLNSSRSSQQTNGSRSFELFTTRPKTTSK